MIGSTGSGKSTLVDLLRVSLSVTGRLLIDGIDLHHPDHTKYLLGWRAAVAHVLRILPD